MLKYLSTQSATTTFMTQKPHPTNSPRLPRRPATTWVDTDSTASNLNWPQLEQLTRIVNATLVWAATQPTLLVQMMKAVLKKMPSSSTAVRSQSSSVLVVSRPLNAPSGMIPAPPTP
eukprot:PhF_6_TR38595/c0_g1_i1/m.57408